MTGFFGIIRLVRRFETPKSFPASPDRDDCACRTNGATEASSNGPEDSLLWRKYATCQRWGATN